MYLPVLLLITGLFAGAVSAQCAAEFEPLVALRYRPEDNDTGTRSSPEKLAQPIEQEGA